MDYKEKVIALLDSKELSQEQKEKLESIFPELKESENIRIIKAIKYGLDHVFTNNTTVFEVTKEQCLAWLEKQGKNNMGISEATKQELEDNLNKALEQETAESWNEFLEKQGEQKPVDPDTLIQQRVDALADIVAEQKPADKAEPKFNIGDIIFNKKTKEQFIITNRSLALQYYHDEDHLHEVRFSEQDEWELVEQKSADKVGPKFREGEWITNGDYTWKVVEVKPLDYILQSQDGNIVDDTISHVDEQFHSFTIQDAKDGDVLSYVTDEDLWIMIYRSLYEPYEGHVHYHALLVNDNFSDKGTCCICIDNLKPATKEQRDLLFSKMKEAGYEWDADRLELKKIEQKPAWSEDDKMMLQYAVDFISTSPHPYAGDILRGEKGKDEVIIWLKSLKQRVQPQPKQEWSEEDIVAIDCAVEVLSKDLPSLAASIERLKSIRPQSQWKPSDKQMKALHAKLSCVNGDRELVPNVILESLYQDLKKLREE